MCCRLGGCRRLGGPAWLTGLCPPVSAEEVRALKARVAELEQSRSGVLLYDEKVERSNKDRLQGAAPGVGADLGKLGLDGHGQEALWLFLKGKLMAEQESGEYGAGQGEGLPGSCAPSILCGILGVGTSIVIPSDCWEN